ncbi:hypothetical protein WJX73_002128 [Symbiochloris irregularis]|uniref:Protein kinase domain-containing protein n=1 Tax=Symbiochloris irregularis TaxID=706552 RepID=A0AAW1PM42_9CHLO
MLSSWHHQTPSQGLNLAFKGFGLDSQPDVAGTCSQQAAPLSSQLSQDQLMFGSQDFITPVEQQTQAEAPDALQALQFDPRRAPGPPSPCRIKRPRNNTAFMDNSWSQGDGEPSTSSPPQSDSRPCPPPPQRQKLRRVLSPRRFSNVFLADASDELENDKAATFRPLPTADISARVFKEVGVLGQGCFSKVTRVQHRLDGSLYAIKRSIRPLLTDADRRQWCQEVQALAAAGAHPGIVQYYGAWMEEGQRGGEHMCIQLGVCGMSLGSRLALQGHPLKEPELLEVLSQMAAALQHLHDRGIAHLDVKPDNIFAAKDEEAQYRLGDFGLARPLHPKQARVPVVSGEGDCRYLPRELLNDDHSQLDKADMFALGCTLYELATNCTLPSEGDKYQTLRDGRLPLLPSLTRSFQDMVKLLMHPEPQRRPAGSAVLASGLLTKRNQSNGFAPLSLQRSSHG